jgi:hypothetical protein
VGEETLQHQRAGQIVVFLCPVWWRLEQSLQDQDQPAVPAGNKKFCLVETLYQLHKECAKSSSCSRVKTQEGYMVFFFSI